jgi:hypothetical protein
MPRRPRRDRQELTVTVVGKPSGAALDLLAKLLDRRLKRRPAPPVLKVVRSDESSGPIPEKL